jgi:peptide/nickel transport system substrate-binding protein
MPKSTQSSALATTRRAFLLSTAALAAGAVVTPRFALAADAPVLGGTLIADIGTEPPVLVNFAHTAGAGVYVSAKTTEGLLTYDFDLKPQPLLATSWDVTPDGLKYTFKLREGVKWHDGKDFTAADVVYSILTLKEVHPRGRATFAHVIAANAVDSHTVEFILDKPSPYLLTALAASESPIVAKHIYDTGVDPAANPNTTAPVGTGPWVFKQWVRGSHVIFTKNPNYWQSGKPYLDQLVIRFIGDPGAASAALETGEVLLNVADNIPLTDVDRLKTDPKLGFETRGFGYVNPITRLEFNFDNKNLADLKVRQAIAHAIDREFIVKVVFLGHAKALAGPVSPSLLPFFTDDLPKYDYDPKKAEALLDEAGLKRGADGVRFKLMVDPTEPEGIYQQAAEYIVQALNKVGIGATLRTEDFATFVKRVYDDRQFDLALEGMSNLFDPTVGIQRLYWSKNFKPGVPFSNGAHYNSAAADALLDAAAVEVDPKKRFEDFVKFQQQVVTDLPALDIVAPDSFLIFDKRVINHTTGAEGFANGSADTYLAKA